MHGYMMENVQKIKIKLENIWIDLIRSIYAPYTPPQASYIPSFWLSTWVHGLGSPLIRISATICSVGRYSKMIFLFSIVSLRKYNLMLKCLVHACIWLPYAIVIADWLSEYICIGKSSGWNTSVIKCWSHKASLAACVNAINSASVNERATCQGPHISYCCLCSLRLCNRRRSRV